MLLMLWKNISGGRYDIKTEMIGYGVNNRSNFISLLFVLINKYTKK